MPLSRDSALLTYVHLLSYHTVLLQSLVELLKTGVGWVLFPDGTGLNGQSELGVRVVIVARR